MSNGEMEEVVIPLSRVKVILLSLAAVAFVGASFWIWSIADNQPRFHPLFMRGFALAGAVLFGLCGIYGCIKVFDGKPGLVIDREGVVDNSSAAPAGRIGWDEITALEVVEVSGQRMLAIRVVDPQKYVERGGPLRRMLNAANCRMTGSPINVSSHALSINFDDLLRVLTAALNRHKAVRAGEL